MFHHIVTLKLKVITGLVDGISPSFADSAPWAVATRLALGCRELVTASHLQKTRCENSNPVACGAHFFPASHRVRFMASGVSWTVVGNARCGQEHGQEASQSRFFLRLSSCMRCVPIHPRARDRPASSEGPMYGQRARVGRTRFSGGFSGVELVGEGGLEVLGRSGRVGLVSVGRPPG